MRAFSRLSALLITAVATGVCAQVSLPQFVRLPTEDFVWNWGRITSAAFEERRGRPDFSINGLESNFRCALTGAFRPSSRMRDIVNMREFEQTLTGTLYFIQDATETLNYYYRSNDLYWATLDCVIPETEITDDKAQERLDRALERAEKERERRRQREVNSDE